MNITSILPDVLLLFLIAFTSVYRSFGINRSRIYSLALSAAFAVSTVLLVQQYYFNPHNSFYANIAIDGFGITLKLILVAASALIYFFTKEFQQEINYNNILNYLTLLFAAFISLSSNNLLLTYISFEIISLTILSALFSQTPGSTKNYYRSWIISSGLMLFGITLFYGMFGSLNYFNISKYLSENPVNLQMLSIAAMMIFCGFALKLFIFPLQQVITGIFDNASKVRSAIIFLASVISGTGALTRFIYSAFNDRNNFNSSEILHTLNPFFDWGLFIVIIFCLTILSSSFLLMLQQDLMKISINIFLVNYALVLAGFGIIRNPDPEIIVLLIIQAIIPFTGIIIIVKFLSDKFSVKNITDLNGLYRLAPINIILLIIFWLSLAGFPLTIGFTSRLHLFSAVSNRFSLLVILSAIFTSLIIFYKIFIISRLLLTGEPVKEKVKPNYLITLLAVILAVVTLLFGIYPVPLTDLLNIISNFVYI